MCAEENPVVASRLGVRFHAEARRGKDLPGVAPVLRVEGTPQTLHRFEVGLSEQQIHEVAFLGANAVLAGDDTPCLDTGAQDLVARRQHTLELVRVATVERDVRMEVPISGVEHVRELQTMTIADLADAFDDLGKLRARHHRIVHVEIRGQPAHGAEGTLAGGPEPLSFLGVLRDVYARCTVAFEDRPDAFRLGGKRGRRPV